MERERVEKELCKFTERLQLDYNLLPKLYFPEEEKIDIEDDFPGSKSKLYDICLSYLQAL